MARPYAPGKDLNPELGPEGQPLTRVLSLTRLDLSSSTLSASPRWPYSQEADGSIIARKLIITYDGWLGNGASWT